MSKNPFVGSWTYRSFLNDPDLHLDKQGNPDVKDLVFGYGTIKIEEAEPEELKGTIGGSGWQLALHGSMNYGNPGQVRFQGKGVVSGAEWIYDYIGWLVPVWPNSNDTLQRRALVGSIVRTIPHPGSDGAVNPAGVVASWYAVFKG
ncbi:MAG TPA: hypothetical protein VFH27_04110 [Longimicrobiaceae bacterium]|nr:hypothetical protein [Longimicrobiaceae bacterium]